ncbi:UNVERIFIED_CONTAM: Retrovirus-related Pol polyprotein from transposon TNT 1-94 [Sesamum calycinum]|uniref:Retrovirus-related Pol polyprotein from transposon TNT 1-94 n=1 Tax=Sesamum calycinum TaxID=2727403 RepID=A0AAW2QUZ2_9LAMI
MKYVPYSNAIGSVMYLMVSTRPDIAYDVSCLSRYMSNDGLPHGEVLKWLLRSEDNPAKHGTCSWVPGVLAMMMLASNTCGFGPRGKL